MKCKNNFVIDCEEQDCENCKYDQGIKEQALNPDNAITGFSFIADDGTPIEGLHLVIDNKRS